MGGPVIAWSCKLKHTSKSVAHAEYAAMAHTAELVYWFRALLEDMGVKHLIKEPTIIYGDNNAANGWTENGTITKANQHVRRDCHYGQEMKRDGVIGVAKVGSRSNISDLFTKAENLHVRLIDCMTGYEGWGPEKWGGLSV